MCTLLFRGKYFGIFLHLLLKRWRLVSTSACPSIVIDAGQNVRKQPESNQVQVVNCRPSATVVVEQTVPTVPSDLRPNDRLLFPPTLETIVSQFPIVF